MGTLAAAWTGGCTPDEHHRDIPPAQTAAFMAYDIRLDENATPEQVTYVLLRSIADDVKAAQAHDKAAQKEALRTTYALLAYRTIEERLVKAEGLTRGTPAWASLGEERDEKLYDFARQLAPIVAHYVRSFEKDFSAARSKMRLIGNPQAGAVHVHYEAAHDPDASEFSERDPVLIDVELVQEAPDNGRSHWRVARVAFAGRPGAVTGTRAAVPRTTAGPATAPATGPGR